MRKRFNVLAVAVVLAIASFAYARYRYSNSHTIDLGEAKITITTNNLFGDWVRDELVFAVIIPVALLAAGATFALTRKT